MIAQRILSVDEFITAVHDILGPVSCDEPTNDSILESSFAESDKENRPEVVSILVPKDTYTKQLQVSIKEVEIY